MWKEETGGTERAVKLSVLLNSGVWLDGTYKTDKTSAESITNAIYFNEDTIQLTLDGGGGIAGVRCDKISAVVLR